MDNICIDIEGNISTENGRVYSFNGVDIYIDGLIYTYGKKAGDETIEWIYSEIVKGNDIPFNLIRGAYSCFIRANNKIVAFSDNSNMHCVYYSDKFLSNRFLSIIEHENDLGTDLIFDEEAICEYLTLGNIYFGKTFYKDIHILDSQYLIVIENNNMHIEDKQIGDLDAKCYVSSFKDFFGKLAYSVSDYKICQALTGGYDSRLVYVCMSQFAKDHAAISGNDRNSKDIKYASQVAQANDTTLHIIGANKPLLTQKLIDSVMIYNDGIEPFDLDTSIRLIEFKKELSRKFDLHLTGDGGVLHKDWEWSQDIPFYRSKKSNAKKFYYQRLCYIDNKKKLGEKLKRYYNEQEKRFVTNLNLLSKSINTESYDSWYYRVSGNRRVYYNNNPISGFISYAPLMELDIVRYSYALPRRLRFFYNSMRNEISNVDLNIARIKTNYGTTASNEIVYLMRDIFFQLIEYSRKAYRLFGRRVLKKNVLSEQISNWSMENEIRDFGFTIESLQFAKEKGYICDDVSISDLSYAELRRIIHIYWLKRKTNNEKD